MLAFLRDAGGDALLLTGPTGAGKTSLIRQVAARLYWPVQELTCHGRMEFADLLERTVSKWLVEERFRPRRAQARASKLDRHKATIRRWLEAHRYSAQQEFQRLREEEGYRGGISIVKEYVHKVRPPRTPAFLTLSFAPGECAQVDWGVWDAVPVGQTRLVARSIGGYKSPPGVGGGWAGFSRSTG